MGPEAGMFCAWGEEGRADGSMKAYEPPERRLHYIVGTSAWHSGSLLCLKAYTCSSLVLW